MQYTFSNKDKVYSKSLGWVSRINTSASPNQGIHTKNRGNNSILFTEGSMPMKSGSADNDASFAMGRKDFVKTVLSSSPMTMNNTDQSSYLARRKAIATGKIIRSAPISFSSKDNKNTVNSSLRKARNKGYVVPKNVTYSRMRNDLYQSKPPCSLTSVNIHSSDTTLRKWEYYQCTKLTSVTFEDTLEDPCQITTISLSAFEGCTSLSSITIPSSVTTIGASAFSGSGLKSIIISASVTSIGVNAFYMNSSLTTVTYKEDSSLSSIGYQAFTASGLTSITIPESVTSIAEYAFSNCTSLTKVIFEAGTSLSSIGSGVFAQCTALHTVAFTSSTIPSAISSSTFPPISQGITAYYTQSSLSQTDIDTLKSIFGDENVKYNQVIPLSNSLGATYQVGDTITLNTLGSGFDTELGLFDENGNRVTINDDAGGFASNGESKIEITLDSVGKYYLVVGGYDIVFSQQDFGITIPSGTATGNGTLSYGRSGEQLSTIPFTIDSANKYRVYTFDIVAA
jgi:hypothetical protein